MIAATTFLLLLALVTAVVLGFVAAVRRSVEWGLLAIVLVFWLFAQLIATGLQVR